MEKIVYFTGAGFSAPLGLPVMGNFYFKSRDMYSENPEKYKHFKEIFKEIQLISVTKNYYSGDLFNVEEILSILDMRAQLEGSKLKKAFLRYLCDVVEFHTPELKLYGRIPGNWHEFLFGAPNSIYRRIATFVANIFNLTIDQVGAGEGDNKERFLMLRRETDVCRYAIVTVNYDRVVEQVVNYLDTNFSPRGPHRITFADFADVEKDTWERPALVKLHGSVDSGTVVPPTWSKGVHKDILLAWRSAHALLRDATQIRILGYSLPVADANVKYLLKSSVTESPQLKAIDVICWDPDGTVKTRYENFIEFRDFRFRSAKLEDYFGAIIEAIGKPYKLPKDKMVFDHLEGAHSRFMESGGS